MTQDIDIKVHELADGLLESTPEEWTEIQCVISRSLRQCGSRLEYEIRCPQVPDEVIEEPSRKLHEAAHESLRGRPDVEGIEMVMKQENEGSDWDLSVQMLLPNEEFDRKEHDEDLWNHVYEKRTEFFEDQLGPFPGDILKLMTVHWPGGGLFKIENSKIEGATAWLSFGMTNPDMPSSAFVEEFERVDGPNNQKEFKTKLGWRVPIFCPSTDSGYGYEFLILSKERDCVVPLMWFIEQELNEEVDWIYRVRRNGGMTIEDAPLDNNEGADWILAPARMLPTVEFTTGDMEVLIPTRVTREEMNFAREDGKIAELLDKLYAAGYGQVSIWDRKSVV